MLFVEQRSDDGVQTNRLTLTSGTSHEQVRHFGQVHHKHLVGNSLSERDGQFKSRVLELFGVDDALHRHDARILLGTSIPMVPLPGIGAMIRMPSAESESAMSSSRLRILLMRTPGAGVTS